MNIADGIVDIVSPHVTALMQVLTNDFPQYNMRLITTKCLNTGIMITFSLLGEKGLQMVDQCDSNRTTDRHKSGIDNNTLILKQLKQQLTSKREKRSKLYYILLSDGYFPKVSNDPVSKYFPGHVVIVEKHFDSKNNKYIYRLHQSYINKYSLKQYNSMSNKYLSMTNMSNILESLERVMMAPVWTQSNIKIWTQLTNVDTTELSDTRSKNKFFLCFRKAEMKTCAKSLRDYIQKKLLEVKSLPPQFIYGNTSLYNDPKMALTNKQIEEELQTLLDKIKQHERLCNKHNNE